MRRIVTFGLCALTLPMLAAGQTKDDFEYPALPMTGALALLLLVAGARRRAAR